MRTAGFAIQVKLLRTRCNYIVSKAIHHPLTADRQPSLFCQVLESFWDRTKPKVDIQIQTQTQVYAQVQARVQLDNQCLK